MDVLFVGEAASEFFLATTGTATTPIGLISSCLKNGGGYVGNSVENDETHVVHNLVK